MDKKFNVNDHVWKQGTAYSGPGIVRGVVHLLNGTRYLVGHKIEGGEGEFLHIYSEKELQWFTPPE